MHVKKKSINNKVLITADIALFDMLVEMRFEPMTSCILFKPFNTSLLLMAD